MSNNCNWKTGVNTNCLFYVQRHKVQSVTNNTRKCTNNIAQYKKFKIIYVYIYEKCEQISALYIYCICSARSITGKRWLLFELVWRNSILNVNWRPELSVLLVENGRVPTPRVCPLKNGVCPGFSFRTGDTINCLDVLVLIFYLGINDYNF